MRSCSETGTTAEPAAATPGLRLKKLSPAVDSLAPVRLRDFFAEAAAPGAWGGTTTELREDLLGLLLAGPVTGVDDLDAAIALTKLVWEELEAYGMSGGTRLDEEQIALAQRALSETLSRVGITLTYRGATLPPSGRTG